jgi:flavin-binding protein dodecin
MSGCSRAISACARPDPIVQGLQPKSHSLDRILSGPISCARLQGGGGSPAYFHTEREDNESWEKAAANAVEQASKSLRDVRIAEIVELDMQLNATGKVEAYRAKVKLSFKIEGS